MSDSIRALASSMVLRKKAGIEPYILFLGAGASISSGCSSMLQIIDDVLGNYSNSELNIWEEKIKSATRINTEFGELLRKEIIIQKRNRFFDIWGLLDHETQYSILKNHLLVNNYPSEGYDYLVQLIKYGFFKTVFSTNLDNLLERTLYNKGLRQPEDFVVAINGKDRSEEIVELLNSTHSPLKIIKLHGSLESPRSYAFRSTEVFDFEKKLKPDLSRYFKQSLIIVGYSGQDRDVDVLFEDEGKEIHFVNPKIPEMESRISQILLARGKGKTIYGNIGNFDTFFRKILTYVEGEERVKSSDSPLSLYKCTTRFSHELNYIFSKKENDYAIEIAEEIIKSIEDKPYSVSNEPIPKVILC
jgi:predicted NACHT family NTPase